MKKKDINTLAEEQLFQPVAAFLEAQGYRVNGEVLGADVAAVRGDEFLIVELKKKLNLEVILQAVDRQKTAEEVYIGVYKDDALMKTSKYKDLLHLLRRLELGLLLVTINTKRQYVEVALTAEAFDRIKSRQNSKKMRVARLKELEGRKTVTAGGITKKKVVTVYKENAVQVAFKLEAAGISKPANLQVEGIDSKQVYDILYRNYYGWFRRLGDGLYEVTPVWLDEKSSYGHLNDQ